MNARFELRVEGLGLGVLDSPLKGWGEFRGHGAHALGFGLPRQA